MDVDDVAEVQTIDGKPVIKTWRTTNRMRWLKAEWRSAVLPRLQQQWRCYETGERRWLDVPVEMEQAGTEQHP